MLVTYDVLLFVVCSFLEGCRKLRLSSASALLLSESPYEARRDACKQISHLSSSFTGCEDGEVGCERTPYVSNGDDDAGDDDLPMPMTMLRMDAIGW